MSDNNLKNKPLSYWLTSTHDTNYPTLNEDLDVDIAIIGGGLAGISCAYLLQKEDFKIAVIDAGRICQGATAHTTAKITSQHGLIYNKIRRQLGDELARQYAEANEKAISEFKKIIDEHHIECDYILQSAFVYTEQEKYIKQIEDEVKAASELGIKASYVEEIPFAIPIHAAVRFDNQAQFHPRKYVLSLAKIIHDNKVLIFENTRAINIEEDDKYIIITEQGKKVRAEKVILTTQYPFYNKKASTFPDSTRKDPI